MKKEACWQRPCNYSKDRKRLEHHLQLESLRKTVTVTEGKLAENYVILYYGLFIEWLKYKTAKLMYMVYRTRNRKQEGNDREERQVLRRFRKTVSVGAEVTSGGKLFQRWLPATGNARSPTVESRVRRITSCKDDDDRRRLRLESATRWM